MDLAKLLYVEVFDAVDFQVVAAAVKGLEPDLRGNASQDSIVDYGNSVAEHIGLLRCLLEGCYHRNTNTGWQAEDQE